MTGAADEGMSPSAKGPLETADLKAERSAASDSIRRSFVRGTPSSSELVTLLNHENPTIWVSGSMPWRRLVVYCTFGSAPTRTRSEVFDEKRQNRPLSTAESLVSALQLVEKARFEPCEVGTNQAGALIGEFRPHEHRAVAGP